MGRVFAFQVEAPLSRGSVGVTAVGFTLRRR
jgi:hypothetical protein